MEPGIRRLSMPLRVSRSALLLSAMMLISSQALAHVMPWRDGVSRQTGFGTCAKGPCLKRTDFSPSVPHVHLAINGRDSVVLCTGLKRKPGACFTGAVHR